ncbi:MAG: hypothetical protein KKC79_13985 [Gammaproteobacteria bacterium]|nr:hypothetical protein [Gammaproteobacteria bacterium]MBU1441476.1 hypothetical protein [Gammaproteobacteria bacterium]MBU2289073.1 hypothetical protein [Gammaproteobacteria bacterium]MBU2409744.1 hypothetical protein [Gammaproteobacteria bacterium]
MGFFKSVVDGAVEVATLGGKSKLDRARSDYRASYAQYQPLQASFERYKNEIDAHTRAIGLSLLQTKPWLDKAGRALSRHIDRPTESGLAAAPFALEKIRYFDMQFDAALSVGVGSAASGALGLGSWVLVSSLGSASTGAAIGGLSGVAATNATLAWFGGGALATGGAGMAGGAAVLGGIIALPLVGFAAWRTHKSADTVIAATQEMDELIIELAERNRVMPELVAAAKNKKVEIVNRCDVLVHEIRKALRIVYPFGSLSIWMQKARALLRLRPIGVRQLAALERLDVVVDEFLSRSAETAADNSCA